MGTREHRIRLAVLMGAITAFGGGAAPAPTTADTFGSLDFYGLRMITPQQARDAFGLKEGDAVPHSVAEREARIRRLEAIPGVERARIERICCDEQGRTLLFVGIEERGAPRFRTLPTPTRRRSVPPTVVATYRRFEAAMAEAVRKGETGDDLSQGHSLVTNVAARRVQEEFPALAATHQKTLRAVLRGAAESEQRRIAAWVLGYAPKKGDVIGDLLRAVRDSDEEVRNNATRSLAAIAVLAQRRPELDLRIDAAPFVAMLNSLTWTDRNKASAVLMALTAVRSPHLLDRLRRRAMPALTEMARWKSAGHALPAYLILGRIAGLEDKAIVDAWTRGERESVIARALRSVR